MTNTLYLIYVLLTTGQNGTLREKFDTLSYHGFIAIERANKMNYSDKSPDDMISIYNTNGCWGFVLYKDKVTKENYEEGFFPQLFCDTIPLLTKVSNVNSKFEYTIFSSIKKNKIVSYQRKIKKQGKLMISFYLLKVKMKYIVVGKSLIFRYVSRHKPYNLQINASICQIVDIQPE